jgi:mono/diheme cytochrome c family protein
VKDCITNDGAHERHPYIEPFIGARPMNLSLLSMRIILLSIALLTVDTSSAETGTKESPSRDSVEDSKRGQELYRASCIVCHGEEAMGRIGPRLAGNPILANEPAFRKVLHEGRHVMPPLKGMLSEQQLTDIRAWLRTLP